MWDAGPDTEGGGTRSDWLGMTEHHTLNEEPGLYAPTLSAPEHRLSSAYLA